MFGLSRKEREADAIYDVLEKFMSEFIKATWRVASRRGMRAYQEWYGESWDERYIVVMVAYSAAVAKKAGFQNESVTLAVKNFCMHKAYGGHGDTMFMKSTNEKLHDHYKMLFSYAFELANVVYFKEGGNGRVVLMSALGGGEPIMDVFADKYLNTPPVCASFNLTPGGVRRTPMM